MPSLPDKNGIIHTLDESTANVNGPFDKKFSVFAFIYDFMQEYFTRPRVHKADPRRHREILASLITPAKKVSVLDIACGTGEAIVHFDKTNDYTGLDVSYAMLKRAVKKAEKKSFNTWRLIHGNAEKMLFEDESFDLVLMDTALHMIPDYQSAIAEVARVLVKEGLFVCSTPTVGINQEFDAVWRKVSVKHSLHSLSVADIEKSCSANGLSFHQYDTNGGMLYIQAYKK